MSAIIEDITDPETGELLHKVVRMAETLHKTLNRVDFSDSSEFLQGAVISIPSNHQFAAHVHIERSRRFSNLRAQESWVVVRGQVEVDYYSEFGVLLGSRTLGEGDASITFRGGHGYRTKGEGALVFEFKSGPYEGQELDKRFI